MAVFREAESSTSLIERDIAVNMCHFRSSKVLHILGNAFLAAPIARSLVSGSWGNGHPASMDSMYQRRILNFVPHQHPHHLLCE